MKKDPIDKKFFWVVLRTVSIEMVVLACVFSGLGVWVGSFFDISRSVSAGCGGVMGVMIAVFSVWRRLRIFLRD